MASPETLKKVGSVPENLPERNQQEDRDARLDARLDALERRVLALEAAVQSEPPRRDANGNRSLTTE